MGVPRVVASVAGKPIRLIQHFFDQPVSQPKRFPREADLSGLKLWHCAVPLFGFLTTEILPTYAAPLAGRPLRILELGAGTGMLGISLAASEGCCVVLTDPALPVNLSEDLEGNTLQSLRENVLLNADVVGDRACARKLLWGDKEDAAALLEEFGGFDLVVGSDLLYDPDNYAKLIETLLAFAPARAVLGYPHRHDGEKRFFEAARKEFAVTAHELEGGRVFAALLAAPRG